MRPHRPATSLELLFDLVFVVAIAQAASRLHHGIVAGHTGEALLSYGMVFFAVWWAWMNFTWFASGYDTDDVPYRLLVLVQLIGALILAAGYSGGLRPSRAAHRRDRVRRHASSLRDPVAAGCSQQS